MLSALLKFGVIFGILAHTIFLKTNDDRQALASTNL